MMAHMAKAIKKRRVCATEGCGTVLSRYNKTKYCNLCDNPRAIRLPTAHTRNGE